MRFRTGWTLSRGDCNPLMVSSRKTMRAHFTGARHEGVVSPGEGDASGPELRSADATPFVAACLIRRHSRPPLPLALPAYGQRSDGSQKAITRGRAAIAESSVSATLRHKQ